MEASAEVMQTGDWIELHEQFSSTRMELKYIELNWKWAMLYKAEHLGFLWLCLKGFYASNRCQELVMMAETPLSPPAASTHFAIVSENITFKHIDTDTSSCQ